MGVPNKFDRLGTIAGNNLPSGYLAAEFLESTGATEKMTVACPPQPYTKWQLETEHAVKEVTIQGKTQQEGINNGVSSFQWATYSYLNSDSVWIQQFFLRGGEINTNLNMGAPNVWGDFKRIMIYITPTTRGGSINGVPYEGESTGFQINVATISLWGTSDGLHLMPGKKKSWKLLVDGKPAYDMIAAIDQQGVPCMYDRVSKQAVYNSSTGQFIVGMTPVQAKQLSKLPITEVGTLTVSLPWEAQWDEGVQSALDKAATKGWTITVQYRDPEVATMNIPASFLESTGTQYVMTGYVPTIDFGARVIFSQEEPDTQTRAVGGVVRPYFMLPRYYLGSQIVGGWGPRGAIYLTDRPYISGKHTSSLNYKNSRLLEFDDTDKHDFIADWTDGYGVLSLFAYNDNSNMRFMGGMRIYDAVFTMQDSVIGHYIPVLDAQGVPCMYDRVTKQLFPSSGTGSFIAGFDTTAQALKLATLPDVTAETDATKKSLTVSLPWEAQLVSTGVPAALQVAAARGWTITVQYRDPEVATENINIDFLEATGTQYINTQMLGGGDLEASFNCMGLDHGATTGGCVFGARLTPNHSEPAAKANGFLISKSRAAFQFSYETTYIFIGSAQLNTFYKVHIKKGVLSVNDEVIYSVQPAEFDSGLNMYMLAYNNINNSATGFFAGRLYNMSLRTSSDARAYIPVLDTAGVPCMYDRVTKQPFYNDGTGVFIAGFETPDKAALGLAKLPVVQTGELTVSLPAAAQDDTTFVPAAIEVARQRGWTIITQYRED